MAGRAADRGGEAVAAGPRLRPPRARSERQAHGPPATSATPSDRRCTCLSHALCARSSSCGAERPPPRRRRTHLHDPRGQARRARAVRRARDDGGAGPRARARPRRGGRAAQGQGEGQARAHGARRAGGRPVSAAKVHHLNCGTMCPRALALLGGPRRLVCHCLLVELGDGLVLVDAGLGVDDVTRTRARLGAAFARIAGAVLDVSECAVRQVGRSLRGPRRARRRRDAPRPRPRGRAHGLPDSAGPRAREGLRGRPGARHAGRARAVPPGPARRREALGAPRRSGRRSTASRPCARLRGRAARAALRALAGTRRSPSATGRWLLHAGDGCFEPGDLASPPSGSFGLSTFQRLVAFDDGARRRNRDRLRGLRTAHPEVRIFSARRGRARGAQGLTARALTARAARTSP